MQKQGVEAYENKFLKVKCVIKYFIIQYVI